MAGPQSTNSGEPTTQNEHLVVMDVESIQVSEERVTPSQLLQTVKPPADYALTNFLSRPVNINNDVWSEGSSYTDSWPIMQLLLQDSNIAEKLSGYVRMRATLNVEVISNASPFQYGAIQFSMKPCGGPYSGGKRVMGAAYDTNATYSDNLSQCSMLPNVVLIPTSNGSVKLTQPFIYHNEWLDLTDQDALSYYVELAAVSVGPLRTASADVGNPVDLSFYAWLTDVELMGPSALVPNSLSSSFSTVGSVAGTLKDVPNIGPFARAAEVAANAASSVASYFGYSHPVPQDPVVAVSIDPTAGLSTTHTSVHMDMLSMDANNALSVGSGGLGFEQGDNLALDNIVTREAILADGVWDTSASKFDTLFKASVQPDLARVDSETGNNGNLYMRYHFTPLSHVAKLFSYWRGDITFKFKFYPSKFHRGKLRLAFDPARDQGVLELTNVTKQITKVVDISEEPEFEMTIPYMSALEWLRTDDQETVAIPSSSIRHYDLGGNAVGYSRANSNGVIRLEVLNRLSTPNLSASVPFTISVCAASGFEFALPRDEYVTVFSYSSPASVNSKKDKVYMGEKILSLRDLIKRYVKYTTFSSPSLTNGATYTRLQIAMRRTPLPPGPATSGLVDTVVANFNRTADIAYSITAMSPITWMYGAFLGFRGGYNWKFVPSIHDGDLTNITVTRDRSNRAAALATKMYDMAAYTGSGGVTTSPSYAAHATVFGRGIDGPIGLAKARGINGMALNLAPVNPHCAVSAPMYSANKWHSYFPGIFGRGSGLLPDQDSANDNIVVAVDFTSPPGVFNTDPGLVDAYVAAADDMSYVFYTGPCKMYASVAPKYPV